MTRARQLLNRSRALLDRSKEAAAQLLAAPQPPSAAPPSDRPRAGARKPAQPQPAAVPVPFAGPEPYQAPAPRRARAPRQKRPNDETLAAVCANVALRDLNLVDSLLSQLEDMEAKEEDAERLAALYTLDHLATRLRRNAENLRVLAGRDATDAASETSSLVDVVRAAMSAIEGYSRVTIGRVVALGVVGFAAEDLSRLLAELLDNATKSSPPSTPVRVSAHLTEQGSVLVRIEDEGIGLPPERLRQLNGRLTDAPVLDDDAVRHMGLAVVRRLAARHGLRAWLDRRVPHGTTASVLLPATLVTELPEKTWSGAQTVVFATPPAKASRRESALAPQPRPAPESAPTSAPKSAPTSQPRAAPGSRPEPRPSAAPAAGGTTASGLPKRVSRSLKNPAGGPTSPTAASRPAGGPATGTRNSADIAAGHAKLLADLDAFADGERAAREGRRDTRAASDDASNDTANAADNALDNTEDKRK